MFDPICTSKGLLQTPFFALTSLCFSVYGVQTSFALVRSGLYSPYLTLSYRAKKILVDGQAWVGRDIPPPTPKTGPSIDVRP